MSTKRTERPRRTASAGKPSAMSTMPQRVQFAWDRVNRKKVTEGHGRSMGPGRQRKHHISPSAKRWGVIIRTLLHDRVAALCSTSKEQEENTHRNISNKSSPFDVLRPSKASISHPQRSQSLVDRNIHREHCQAESTQVPEFPANDIVISPGKNTNNLEYLGRSRDGKLQIPSSLS